MESKKVEYTEADHRMVAGMTKSSEGNGKMLVKGYSVSVIQGE